MTTPESATRVRASRTLAVLTAALTATISCGGSEPPSRAPETTEREPRSVHASVAKSDPSDDAPRPAPRVCTDETCFACGAGYCPKGFYCDEAAQGGAACSWLPACATKSGCTCLGRALSGCTCEDTEGGPHVRCK